VQLAAAGGDPEALTWQPQLVPFPHPQVRVSGGCACLRWFCRGQHTRLAGGCCRGCAWVQARAATRGTRPQLLSLAAELTAEQQGTHGSFAGALSQPGHRQACTRAHRRRPRAPLCAARRPAAPHAVLQLRSIGMVGYVLGPFIFAACMFGMVMQVRLSNCLTA
jgi:hypothetical protein